MVGFISCLVLFSCAHAGLFDSLDDKAINNADDACADLDTSEKCAQAGPCVWSGSACAKDPCFERTVTTTSSCPSVTSGTCVRVPKFVEGGGTAQNSHFCISDTRLTSFQTQAQICSLEWGGWKFVELAACKTLSTDSYGCGPVDKIDGKNDSHYVCKVGNPPDDPCTAITDADLCTYVGECMYVGQNCVADECWEKTFTGNDNCKTNVGATCERHILNSGGSPLYGYCKTEGHDLHSPCNVGTATNLLTKQAVCTWAGTHIPADCNKVATINNYDGGTYYACNPVGEEFDVGQVTETNAFS